MAITSLSTWGHDVRNMPIRQKLMLIVMATTAVALVLAGVGIVFADFMLFRGYLKNDLSALANIIAENTTASLSFEDPAAAAETLATLHSRPHVVTGCVFKNGGALFAEYTRPGASAVCPPPQSARVIRFDRGILLVSRPILLNTHRLGTLVLVYDLGEVYERVQLYGATVIAVFLFATLIAFLLSSRLRSLIATPIIDLARVATRVSNSRDYRIRAQKFSNDESGLLVEAFNEMLAGIQSRDNGLQEALLAREVALKDAQKARESLETSLASVARLNRQLRTSNENLARSNEDLERFAFIASHDLQEPLRMITIYSQLLVRRYAGMLDTEAANYVETIEGGTKRMRLLLADLLTYAEIGARSEEPAQAIDLNVIVETARENLAVSIAETGAIVNVAPLPVIRGFESHFTALFQNLISNSIKYRSDRQPEINIDAIRVNEDLQICVADNGIGIAPEYHSKIFAAFKRLHGQKIPGTGIGLAICQRVIERYGGRIWVESDLGHGSKFIFTLPGSLLVATGF